MRILFGLVVRARRPGLARHCRASMVVAGAGRGFGDLLVDSVGGLLPSLVVLGFAMDAVLLWLVFGAGWQAEVAP